MIKLYGRMIPAVARGMRHDRIAATEPLASRFRVLPHDIDINLHLNNGRYLQLMDVNRVEWLMRTGVLDFVRKHRWKPILGSTVIHFRRDELQNCLRPARSEARKHRFQRLPRILPGSHRHQLRTGMPHQNPQQFNA